MATVDNRNDAASDNRIHDIDRLSQAAANASKDLSDALSKDIEKIEAAAKERANALEKENGLSIGSIILWRSPVHSAAVLACGILLFGVKLLLIHRYGYTIPTLLCRACQLSIIAAGIIHAFAHKDLNADQIHEFAERALNNLKTPITNSIGLICYVLQWKNTNTTFEALLLLLLASWLFNVLSIGSVLFILFCTTMTVPALYELKRPAIESFVQKQRKQLNNSIAHVCDSLPPAIHAQLHKIGVVLPTDRTTASTQKVATKSRKSQ